ncbi:hypothetical protein CEXT_232831 [Caerostris extrusa]|uniref:Uncharacterized protein n=1 Tax=Caerostris extrusa TaxID=172846 RepID=A0AAV4XC88_CAEEX|nr:hypothetical protein CEXT_232831 [Caerostris extrusa]
MVGKTRRNGRTCTQNFKRSSLHTEKVRKYRNKVSSKSKEPFWEDRTVRESFHASALCGSREVIVSREIWKAIGEKEAYKYQTLPDEFVTVSNTKSF